jgi:subtilase family serine protease
MKPARLWALTGAVGLAVSFLAAAGSAVAATHPSPARVSLHGSLAPAAARSHPAGSVAATSNVSFQLSLKLRNAAGARNFAAAVSNPHSKQFHHYLTRAQWVSRYAPTNAEVNAAKAWLRHEGLTVGAVAKDRLFVSAHGSASKVERAFSVSLGYFMVNGHKLRLANSALSIPRSVGGSISGVVGVNQALMSTSLTSTPAASTAAKPKDAEPGPPAGFRNPQPCSRFWGQKTDTADSSSLYAPYTSPQSYDICGYKPSQLRSGYGINRSVARGNNGHGVTVAIVDAYDSPTLLPDAQHYYHLNDPGHPLRSGQFTNVEPSTVGNEGICGGSGWYAEQALDVESVHAMAPGAHIEYVGAQDCFDNNLLAAVDTAVSSASVVTDSWGDTLGDIFAGSADENAFDTEFEMADSTGVSVLFSSGDDGDNFADFGIDAPDYPATSPLITAVGGTTLEVNRFGSDIGQFGWSTAKQTLCASTTTNCGSATTPAGALNWQAGGGGGTSFSYAEPSYQVGVVPDALANRNDTIEGAARVEPDISMDADAQSGMLIGLTQVFPDGTHYGQFKEGGTSLASPLLAGVIADTDQAAKARGNTVLGFLNPILYGNYNTHPTAFDDIVPPASPNATSVIRVDYANTVDNTAGFLVSLRAIDYAGPETYCDGTGNCATRPVTLTAAPGFDSLTGLGTPGPNFITEMSHF